MDISRLPDDLVRELFSHLQLKELWLLGSSSKLFYRHFISSLTLREQLTLSILDKTHMGFQNVKKYSAWNPREEEMKCFDWLCDFGCKSFSAQNHQQMLSSHFEKVHGVSLRKWLVCSSVCKHVDCKPIASRAYDVETWKESLCSSCGSIQIKFDGYDANGFCERGRRFYSKGVYFKAIEDFTQAIVLQPRSTHFLCFRGNAFCEMGEFRKALEDFEKSLKINPCAFMYYNIAITLTNLNEYQKAIESYTQAISSCTVNKDKALYYNNRANIIANMENKDYDKAIEDYTQAIALDKFPMFYSNRAAIYLNKRQFDLALEDYTQAIKLNPNNPMYFSARSNCYIAYDDLQSALKDVNEAIRLDNSSIEYLVDKSRILADMSELTEALQHLDLALRINPKHADSLHLRSEIYCSLHRYKEALQDCTKSIQIQSNRWRLLTLAVIHEKLNNVEESLYCYQVILNSNPADCKALVARSAFSKSLRRYDDSLRDLFKVIKLEPKTSQVLNQIGVTLYLSGKKDQALQYFVDASNMNPNQGIYWSNIGETLCGLKRYEESITALKKSIEIDIEKTKNEKKRTSLTTAPSSMLFQRVLIAYSYCLLSHYDVAEKEADLILIENSKQSRAHLVKGIVYRSKREYEKAVSSLETFFEGCQDEEVPPIEEAQIHLDYCKKKLLSNY